MKGSEKKAKGLSKLSKSHIIELLGMKICGAQSNIETYNKAIPESYNSAKSLAGLPIGNMPDNLNKALNVLIQRGIVLKSMEPYNQIIQDIGTCKTIVQKFQSQFNQTERTKEQLVGFASKLTEAEKKSIDNLQSKLEHGARDIIGFGSNGTIPAMPEHVAIITQALEPINKMKSLLTLEGAVNQLGEAGPLSSRKD